MSQMAEEQDLKKIVDAWTEAEARADTAFLEKVLAEDFIGIGPLGFMLNKEDWLQRHKSGDLKYQSLNLDEVKVRQYGEAAIITARLIQQASYRGQGVPGQFRMTVVWVKQPGGWRLAGYHVSPIAQRPPA